MTRIVLKNLPPTQAPAPGKVRRVMRGAVAGFVIGWFIGMIWWTCLMVSFGPSVRVAHDATGWHEEQVTVLSRVCYAPLNAIPWALVGGFVGTVIGWTGGWLEVIATVIGLVGALLFTVFTNPFDGWLVLTMQVNAAVGTFAGLTVGLVLGAIIRAARKRRAS